MGAKFEVFLKSAGSYAATKDTERDILTCDENGFAETKDLPYPYSDEVIILQGDGQFYYFEKIVTD